MKRRRPNGPEGFEDNVNLVRTVQRILIGKGYDPGPVDGLWGTLTRVAVREYQSDNGLPADGVLDRRTLDRLMAER